MSYTMTLDVPQKTAAYAMRYPQLQEELKAIFMALVSTRMRNDAGAAAGEEEDETPGPALLASFREADEIADGKRPAKWFKTVEELAADCLA